MLFENLQQFLCNINFNLPFNSLVLRENFLFLNENDELDSTRFYHKNPVYKQLSRPTRLIEDLKI